MTATLDAQITCVIRELSLRKAGYPGMIERGSMSADRAADEIAGMESVLGTLRMVAGAQAKGIKPVIIFFEQEDARQQFIELVREVVPGMKEME